MCVYSPSHLTPSAGTQTQDHSDSIINQSWSHHSSTIQFSTASISTYSVISLYMLCYSFNLLYLSLFVCLFLDVVVFVVVSRLKCDVILFFYICSSVIINKKDSKLIIFIVAMSLNNKKQPAVRHFICRFLQCSS